MTEIRLLTDEASRTRFNFVWTVEGTHLPLLAVIEAERLLRRGLEAALDWHGPLSRAQCAVRVYE